MTRISASAALVFGTLVSTGIAPAQATVMANPPVHGGFIYFTPHRPSYRGNDRHGHITGQVTYGRKVTIAWSYRLNAATAGLAVGPMHERADLFCGMTRVRGYHDDHNGVPSHYLIHTSYRGLNTRCRYTWQVFEQFRVAHGGVATIVAHLQFVIRH